MPTLPGERLRSDLKTLVPGSPQYATEAVERMLAEARLAGASDLHVQPTAEGLELRWRLDGVLHPAAMLPASVGPNVIARLKVLADLLTYRTDTPQEGRIKGIPGAIEMRLSTFPTLHGEKAVGAPLRRLGSLPPARRSGPAGRDPRGPRAAAPGDIGDDRLQRSLGRGQDDDALRLPPRAGRHQRGRA